MDKEAGSRKLEYKDIAILHRSPSTIADIYEKELEELGISVFSDTGSRIL